MEKGTETIFLVFDKEAYFYPFEEQCIQPLFQGRVLDFLRKLCRFFKIGYPRLLVNKEIFAGKKIIFTDTVFNPSLLKCCKKFYQPKDIYLYYMNVIDSRFQKYIDYFDVGNVYTFDSDDAKKYGLKYLHTPYSDCIKLCNGKMKYDTVFLGRAKNRMQEIKDIYGLYQKRLIKSKFMVLDCEEPEIGIDQYISYVEYLNVLSESNTITEINIKDQAGCSLRMLESLFFKKKLVTNNRLVGNDPFYDKDNVYILGMDDREIEKFCKSKYKTEKDVSALVFKEWIKHF